MFCTRNLNWFCGLQTSSIRFKVAYLIMIAGNSATCYVHLDRSGTLVAAEMTEIKQCVQR
jgi:hypothetical protein